MRDRQNAKRTLPDGSNRKVAEGEREQLENESDRLEKLNEKLKSKLVTIRIVDHNQRMIVLGNKLNDLAERFFQNNKKAMIKTIA